MNFSSLISSAIQKAGKQEHLATLLDLAPSALSKRINGEAGWQEKEIDKLLAFVGVEILDCTESERKISVLKEALKIIMDAKP